MLRTITLLARRAIADHGEALHDANAVAILHQQIRDGASALALARRELAVAIAYHAAEARALDLLVNRIETLTEQTRRALVDGHDDLGHEASILIAALEDERDDRQSATARFAIDVERLKALVLQGQDRLRDIDRGLQVARAAEAVRRASSNGRREAGLSRSALDDAEVTLNRLRDRQQAGDDVAEALLSLDVDGPRTLDQRLAAAGYGRWRTDPKTVLDRLKAPA